MEHPHSVGMGRISSVHSVSSRLRAWCTMLPPQQACEESWLLWAQGSCPGGPGGHAEEPGSGGVAEDQLVSGGHNEPKVSYVARSWCSGRAGFRPDGVERFRGARGIRREDPMG